MSKALGGSCTLRMEWAEVHYSSSNSQHPNLDLVFTIQGVLASTHFQRAPSKIREFKLLPCKLTSPKGLSHFYCVCNNSTLAALSPKRIQRRTFKSMNFRDNSRGGGGGYQVAFSGQLMRPPTLPFRPLQIFHEDLKSFFSGLTKHSGYLIFFCPNRNQVILPPFLWPFRSPQGTVTLPSSSNPLFWVTVFGGSGASTEMLASTLEVSAVATRVCHCLTQKVWILI